MAIKTSFHCSSGLTKTLDFIRPFLAMATKTSFHCSSGLTKTLDFIRPFLAMATKTSFHCSSGLTKTFDISANVKLLEFPPLLFLNFQLTCPPFPLRGAPTSGGRMGQGWSKASGKVKLY
jgi:hypothetical protein